MRLLARFAADERGATAVEYGLIIAFLTLGILVAMQSTGVSLRGAFERTNNALAAI